MPFPARGGTAMGRLGSALIMRILEYVGLDTTGVSSEYRKVVDAISRDDFRSAEVKKLVNVTHGKFYRAQLDHAWLIPLSEAHLRLLLKSWIGHYNRGRAHMALGPGVPDPPTNIV